MTMKTSGDRMSWLNAVADHIMDGGETPPSIDHLNLVIPDTIVTGINDGHVTAAAAFGEEKRKDYRAGQQFIIKEMVEVLREQGFVNGNDQALRWLKPLDGIWKVKLGDREFTVRGQRQRRLLADRNMLGESDEADGSQIGPDGTLASGRSRPFEVDVIGRRGGKTRQGFQVHPLALAIPPMTEAERESLRASIERDGVKVPLVIYEGKVLDGRNRLYFASSLDKPVTIEEFKGSEEEARRHVAILNLHRRHLMANQRQLAAVRLFGEETTKETKEALEQGRVEGGKVHACSPSKIAESKSSKEGKEWHQIVARKAKDAGIPGVTASGVKAMKEVIDAPETAAAVDRGEIRTVAAAHAAALAEKGKPPSTEIQGVSIGSVNKRLGQCIEHLSAILTDCEMPVGDAVPEKISERIGRVESLISQVRIAMRDRRVIN